MSTAYTQKLRWSQCINRVEENSFGQSMKQSTEDVRSKWTAVNPFRKLTTEWGILHRSGKPRSLRNIAPQLFQQETGNAETCFHSQCNPTNRLAICVLKMLRFCIPLIKQFLARHAVTHANLKSVKGHTPVRSVELALFATFSQQWFW
jgi:hypothetical protein